MEDYFSNIRGKNDVETILNVQNFIIKNFSFQIENGAEGWAYYGGSGETTIYDDAPIFKYIDAIVKNEPNRYGYISSTQAGKLFNDRSFNAVFQETLQDDRLIQNLYNGENSSGKLLGDIQAMNDFFSENYIKNLKNII